MIRLTQKLSPDKAEGKTITNTLALPFDERKKGRLRATTTNGEEVGIFVERGEVLRDGTLLATESGEVYQIKAAAEEVTTAHAHDPLTFARGCYHLGNRHVPLQIGPDWLRYQRDYVLDDMLVQLGLHIHHESAPFEPESGAYGEHGGHRHHHDGDNHDHHHDHHHTHEH
jgi:urease accessory protein